MKLKLTAVAVAFAALAPVAHADVQTSFPDGYVVLSAADKQPIAGAVSEWEIRRNFPKGSSRTGDTLTPADYAAAPSNAALVAQFPQTSFYAESSFAGSGYAGQPAAATSRTAAVTAPAIESTSPDGYRPVAGSVGAPLLVQAFPKPSFIDYVETASGGAVAVTSEQILATFPQPSSVAN